MHVIEFQGQLQLKFLYFLFLWSIEHARIAPSFIEEKVIVKWVSGFSGLKIARGPVMQTRLHSWLILFSFGVCSFSEETAIFLKNISIKDFSSSCGGRTEVGRKSGRGAGKETGPTFLLFSDELESLDSRVLLRKAFWGAGNKTSVFCVTSHGTTLHATHNWPVCHSIELLGRKTP